MVVDFIVGCRYSEVSCGSKYDRSIDESDLLFASSNNLYSYNRMQPPSKFKV